MQSTYHGKLRYPMVDSALTKTVRLRIVTGPCWTQGPAKVCSHLSFLSYPQSPAFWSCQLQATEWVRSVANMLEK